MSLSVSDMKRLFGLLNTELVRENNSGELYLVGGAVMCLAFGARASTKDVDGFFRPTTIIRKAACRVALDAQISEDWLNDAVKGFLSNEGEFSEYLELSNLKIMTARPEYLLAMKCLAMRLGEEFHDEADIRFLLRYLNISSYAQALKIIEKYYPRELFPPKTLYALEELLP
ncbi:MAG: hypothetical protein V3V31_10035 [Methylococcales bacterium]